MKFNKKCKYCGKLLNKENAAKNGMRNGNPRYRDECKSCRSYHVTKRASGNIKVIERMKLYHKLKNQIIEYPCIVCSKLCSKKNNINICSDACKLINNVDKINGCWLWKKALGKHGYGEANISGNQMRAHKASYIIFKGDIPKGLYVCHSCDIKQCINPDHLWLGTPQDNRLDAINKNLHIRKLTTSDVLNIRNEWDNNYYYALGSDLCIKYNISPGHLNSIVKRKIWKHI